MLNIAVLDDDFEILRTYKELIPDILQKHNISGRLVLATANHLELLDEIRKNEINVCILDINLRDNANGMHVAKQIREMGLETHIIFVTGCLDFVKHALEVRACGFIYKPEWGEELEMILVKLEAESELRKQPYIKVKCNSQIFFITIADINSIERLNARTVVHSGKGDYTTYEGLEEIICRINDPRFKRCHRAAFVNTGKIFCIDLKSKLITLNDGSTCNIGPKFFTEFYEEGQDIL